jgi:fatty acid desaturase
MADFTPPRSITWYRSPLPPGEFKKLHERSDLLGGLQTLGYLGTLAVTGGASLYSASHGPWPLTVALIFLHGTCYAFLLNAMHELIHGTVFRTKGLNAFFLRVVSFLGLINFPMFSESHARHHRYTLHPPDDLEVVLPIGRVFLKTFLKDSIVRPHGLYPALKGLVRIAAGRFQGEWERALFPAGGPERREARRWAWILLTGHLAIITVSLYLHLWLLPVLVTLGPFYGACLHAACNATQHVGLQDDVSDFRLCCRTFTVNPVVQFLYWHMNFHIEHHMYAAVPCYRLGRLHRLIQADLPPSPDGLIATWREIAAIQAIQAETPEYEHVALVPERAS